MDDRETEKILKAVRTSNEPLETKEIEEKLEGISRSKILYRLNDLRAQGKIKGKRVGSGKGTWIWWYDKTFF